jgi:hypothetical protein
MSERSWMTRVWIVMRTRMEVRTGSEGTGLRLVRQIETRMSERMPERNVRVEFRELVVRIDTELRVRSVYMNTGLQGGRRVF